MRFGILGPRQIHLHHQSCSIQCSLHLIEADYHAAKVIEPSQISKMAPSAQSHSRSHSLLLVQKLLNLRDSASPLTLVLDTIEQSAAPLLREFMGRARVGPTFLLSNRASDLIQPYSARCVTAGTDMTTRYLELKSSSSRLRP